MTNKKFDPIRSTLMQTVSDFLTEKGEEVLRTNSNEVCMPIVSADGDEAFLVLTFKVPTGSRDGDPYDGYAIAADYKAKCLANAEKAQKKAIAKAQKIERDRKIREAKAKAKAEREKTQ